MSMRVASLSVQESCDDRDASASVLRAAARLVVYAETTRQRLESAPHDSTSRTPNHSNADRDHRSRKPAPAHHTQDGHN
jgi:hypothetical protein